MIAALLSLALAAAPESPAAPSPAPSEAERASRPRTVAGKVARVDLPGRSLTLDSEAGPQALSLDRNTVVFLETRRGTVRDLAAGLSVRAAVGPKGEAYWVEIAAPTTATPTPTPTPARPPGP